MFIAVLIGHQKYWFTAWWVIVVACQQEGSWNTAAWRSEWRCNVSWQQKDLSNSHIKHSYRLSNVCVSF